MKNWPFSANVFFIKRNQSFSNRPPCLQFLRRAVYDKIIKKEVARLYDHQEENWSYEGKNGPEHWAEICETYQNAAAFPDQSPISLGKQELGSPSEQLSFHYKSAKFTRHFAHFAVHLTPLAPENHLIFRQTRYNLTDIHYHMPSEHTLDHQHSPLEIHLVHRSAADKLLVVGVLCRLPEKPRFAEKQSQEARPREFDPAELLPNGRTGFHYRGSLTTPPTAGPVLWFVFEDIISLEQPLFDTLGALKLAKNNRPLQEKNDRPITRFEAKKVGQ